MMMDIRPQQSSPPAMPGPIATPSSAIAPALVDAAGTAPPSIGPGSPHDGSPGDDGANGQGVARRPGNLWTSEDREDMFNRRERGEGWETICADYPNRSRHAMQQQYSMMKKQKALADGTWASNRRGRKRRNPAPERPSASAKRTADHYSADMDENMTEIDDNDDGPSDDLEDSDDAGGRLSNGRPNALMRSATEPAKVIKSRQSGAYGANGVSVDSHGTPIMGHGLDVMPDRGSGFTSVNRGRKRRLSADRMSNPNVTPPVESQPGAGNIVLNSYDILSLLQKGEDWARKSKRAQDEERNAQAQAFESAVSRANKRATEAQEKFSYASFEHGEAVKKLRIEFNETLKARSREHKEATDKITADFHTQLKTQMDRIDAHARENEELRRQIEVLKRDLPDRERQMDNEITRLRNEKQTLEEAKKTWEDTAKEEVASLKSAPPAEPADQKLAVPVRSTETHSDTYLANEDEVYRSCQDMCNDFRKSAIMIADFHAEFEELGHKRTVQYLSDIAKQTQNTSTLMETFRSKFDQLHRELRQPLSPAEVQKSQKVQASLPMPVAVPHPVPAALPSINSISVSDIVAPNGHPDTLSAIKEENAAVAVSTQAPGPERSNGDIRMLDSST